MSSYQLVTEVWLGTKWKAKRYPPTTERVSELVSGRASALEFIVILMTARFVVKVARVLVKVWVLRSHEESSVWTVFPPRDTIWGKLWTLESGPSRKNWGTEQHQGQSFECKQRCSPWPEQPSLSWEQKWGKPVSELSHHWSISCSDLTMTDPCCLTALSEAASSPYSAEADLQLKLDWEREGSCLQFVKRWIRTQWVSF